MTPVASSVTSLLGLSPSHPHVQGTLKYIIKSSSIQEVSVSVTIVFRPLPPPKTIIDQPQNQYTSIFLFVHIIVILVTNVKAAALIISYLLVKLLLIFVLSKPLQNDKDSVQTPQLFFRHFFT